MSEMPTDKRMLICLQDLLAVAREINRKMDIQVKALKLKYGERLEEDE